MKFDSQRAREMGRLGGQATYRKHGRTHMQQIGHRGFWSTCDKHFGSDVRLMLNTLIHRGLIAGDAVPGNGYITTRVSNRLYTGKALPKRGE